MTILEDAYIVLVDKQYESTESAAGIISMNTAYIDPQEEGRHQHKRVYGQVLACPSRFSDKVVNLIDIGMPPPSNFIGHEYIQSKSSQGMSLSALPSYCPSTFEGYPEVTVADIAKNTDIQRFDRVYFDYLCTSDQNYLGDHQGSPMYRIDVDKIFAAIRKGDIIMQAGWTLVEPDMEDWEDIKTPSGIYKKPSPEAKHLLGFVRHMQPRTDLSIGDRIVYINDADAPLKVEGKDFYCMHRSEILCRI
jgi:co-chaperonin GroES (HSP10)